MSSGFSEEALKRLEEAISQGITTVHYADRTISYRSLDEMLKIRALIQRQLSLLRKPASQSIVMSFDKGF